MDVTSLATRCALVTGAGSGIGRAGALAFARRGADLAICDIDEEGLAETERRIRELGRDAHAQRVDVADAEQMRDFAAAVHERWESVDILMNNAGVAIGGGFLETSIEDWDWIVGVNLRGVVLGCHYFVPAMVKRGRGGHVVNVASAAGYSASEYLAAYCTTKFAVVGVSETLREELARRDIGVTAICPGIIDTPITENARLVGTMARFDATRKTMVDRYKRRAYGPDRVATNILKAIGRNRAVAPITPEAWALYYLKRFAPGALRWISGRVGKRTRRDYGLD